MRIATVVVGYTGTKPGFVLAGRSLREVEKRESQVEMEVEVAWIITLLGSLVIVTASEFFLSYDKASK